MKQQEWEWWGDLDNLSRPLGTSQVQANSGFPAGQARAREQRQTSSPRARGSLAHTLPHLLDYSLVVLQERLYICLVAPATLPLRILHSSNAGHGIDLFYIFFFPFTLSGAFALLLKIYNIERTWLKLWSAPQTGWKASPVSQLSSGAFLVFELWKRLLSIPNSKVQGSLKHSPSLSVLLLLGSCSCVNHSNSNVNLNAQFGPLQEIHSQWVFVNLAKGEGSAQDPKAFLLTFFS